MFSALATGDGYWLASGLLAVLLCLYLWIVIRLIQQLRQPSNPLTQSKLTQTGTSQTKFISLIALLVGLLCLLPLFDYWYNGYSGYHSIGGLLPYSDAADWLHGAFHLASQGELTNWAARRPLNAVFLSGLLHLSDSQIPVMLVLRALLVAAAVSCWCAELQRHMPRLPALFTSLLVVVLAYPYLPVLLSESHGLLFGLLGFTLLLRGVTFQNLTSYAVGAGLLSCALMLRMGGFGLLLGLLLWPLALTRAGGALRWILTTALSISAGIALSLLWGSLVYSGANTSGSNFSYTLYGLAHGGAPWQLFFEHYPQVLKQTEAAQAALAYQAAWTHIQSNPLALLQGWWQFFSNYWRYLFVWVPGSLGQFLLPVFALGLIQITWGWRNLSNRFILLCFAGVLLTTPWIFWSANASRAFIATTALELLIVGRGIQLLVLGGQGLWEQASELPLRQPVATAQAYGSWVTVVLCLACVTLIPSWASRHPLPASADVQALHPACTAPAIRLWVDPKLSFFVGLYPSGELGSAQTYPPPGRWNQLILEHSQFGKNQLNPNPIAAVVRHESSATTQLWWVFDANDAKHYRYLIVGAPFLATAKGFIDSPRALCVEPVKRAKSRSRSSTPKTSEPGAKNTSPPLLWQAVAS